MRILALFLIVYGGVAEAVECGYGTILVGQQCVVDYDELIATGVLDAPLEQEDVPNVLEMSDGGLRMQFKGARLTMQSFANIRRDQTVETPCEGEHVYVDSHGVCRPDVDFIPIPGDQSARPARNQNVQEYISRQEVQLREDVPRQLNLIRQSIEQKGKLKTLVVCTISVTHSAMGHSHLPFIA